MYKMAVYTSDAKIYQLVEQVMSEIGMRVDIEIQVSHLDEEAFDYQMIFVDTTSELGLGPIQKCIGQGEGLCPKVIVLPRIEKFLLMWQSFCLWVIFNGPVMRSKSGFLLFNLYESM